MQYYHIGKIYGNLSWSDFFIKFTDSLDSDFESLIKLRHQSYVNFWQNSHFQKLPKQITQNKIYFIHGQFE